MAQYEGWNGLSHMLLTGETAFDHVNGGKDLWAYYNEPQHHEGKWQANAGSDARRALRIDHHHRTVTPPPPEQENFQTMLVQTLAITTPPIVQDFDWPSLVERVQREKGSEQISIIDVGGGTFY
jgi:hypothetical protein